MSGITVGIDGSAHSSRALEWALNQAAARHAPVTVLTVRPVALANRAQRSHDANPIIDICSHGYVGNGR